MSHAGLLERVDAYVEDDWIEIEPAARATPAESSVLDAIAVAQASIMAGNVAEAEVDLDALGEIDELDDAAIRAFLDDND